MICNRRNLLGQILILSLITSILTGCHTLKKDPATQRDEGKAIWVGNRGEQPKEVWQSRPYVICDATIYYCTKF